jgi:hypothetical protein
MHNYTLYIIRTWHIVLTGPVAMAQPHIKDINTTYLYKNTHLFINIYIYIFTVNIQTCTRLVPGI